MWALYTLLSVTYSETDDVDYQAANRSYRISDTVSYLPRLIRHEKLEAKMGIF